MLRGREVRSNAREFLGGELESPSATVWSQCDCHSNTGCAIDDTSSESSTEVPLPLPDFVRWESRSKLLEHCTEGL